jgi:molybdopterin/thiamine biosynthesis adenylyltransferase
VRLDDAQIDRYSRQIVLAEIGPKGQEALAAAHVGVGVAGPAAERVVAYLAAAGVGHLTLPTALRGLVDPAQPDVALTQWPPAPGTRLDAALTAPDDATEARRRFWTHGGRAGEVPPCAACAAAALGPEADVDALLAPLRAAVLGTVVATEIVKALIGIGTGMRGGVLAYDPTSATFTSTPVAPRAACAVCAGAAQMNGG